MAELIHTDTGPMEKTQTEYDLAVIGGGPAGMAAAWAAAKAGVERIVLFERNERLGGILPQCIHNGFGIGLYGIDYTGPEYACLWEKKLLKENRETQEPLQIFCETTVLNAEKTADGSFLLTCLGMQDGCQKIKAKAVIFANGCRERTLGQMRIPGSRPAGIFMAGSAQYMVNISNLKPGNTIAIMGFGDIGLIMARRLTLEGMKVRMIFGEQANGLVRNYVQCIREFGIESRIHYTLLSTHGYKRLKGITIAPKDENGKILYEKKEYVHCDTLLVAAGLIPETELWDSLGLWERLCGGIPADEHGKTPVPGIFACGNVTEIADLVDKVTIAGIRAGSSAAAFLEKDGKGTEEVLSEYKDKLDGMAFFTPLKMENKMPKPEQFVCSVCPNGCIIRPDKDGFFGQRCSKGIAFAQAYEKTGKATYVLSSTVRVENGDRNLLAARMDRKMTHEEMMDIMPKLRKVRVKAPIKRNQVIWEDRESGLRLLAAEPVNRGGNE